MALLIVAGESGCPVEQVARLAAQRLGWSVVTEAKLRDLIAVEFGSETAIPPRAWPYVASSILAKLSMEEPLAVAAPGCEFLLPELPGTFRAQVTQSDGKRIGALMLEHRMDRPAAAQLLRQWERAEKEVARQRFAKSAAPVAVFDLICNLDRMESDDAAALVEHGARLRGLVDQPLLPAAAEAQVQFQMRLQLAKFGIAPPSRAELKRKPFANPSEEIFANLLDFYRIGWEYEPRSFPIQWDAAGHVTEAFTPDFYLPEFDLYVELTTMKQAHVTRKNRKVKLLRSLYPHVNIQVFYEKDFRNLIFKHDLGERLVPA